MWYRIVNHTSRSTFGFFKPVLGVNEDIWSYLIIENKAVKNICRKVRNILPHSQAFESFSIYCPHPQINGYKIYKKRMFCVYVSWIVHIIVLAKKSFLLIARLLICSIRCCWTEKSFKNSRKPIPFNVVWRNWNVSHFEVSRSLTAPCYGDEWKCNNLTFMSSHD